MNQGPTLPLASGLEWAHPLVRDWFVGCFGTPTEPQQEGWPQILAGKTTLISAPTGSGENARGLSDLHRSSSAKRRSAVN